MPSDQGHHPKKPSHKSRSGNTENHDAHEQLSSSHLIPYVPDINGTRQPRNHILVVDDDPLILETAEHILGSEGYEVLTAADGVEALNLLSTELPDLIISDLNMPRMSGVEFLAIVRERFPQIATIAISGECAVDKNTSVTFADAFLRKGQYSIAQLLREIARLLKISHIR